MNLDDSNGLVTAVSTTPDRSENRRAMKAKRSNRTNQKGIDAVPAHVAQSVEHVLGKDEVTGSSPVVGSSAATRVVVPTARKK